MASGEERQAELRARHVHVRALWPGMPCPALLGLMALAPNALFILVLAGDGAHETASRPGVTTYQ